MIILLHDKASATTCLQKELSIKVALVCMYICVKLAVSINQHNKTPVDISKP